MPTKTHKKISAFELLLPQNWNN